MDSLQNPSALSASRSGRAIAGRCLKQERALDEKKGSQRRELLEDGFKAVSESSETTIDEKIIAAMALRLQKKLPDDRLAVAVSHVFMDALSASLPGAPGASLTAAIADTAYNAFLSAGPSKYKQDKRPEILKDGFETLQMNSASKKERAMAEFGRAMLKEKHLIEAFYVMGAMSQPLPLPCAVHIARAVLRTTAVPVQQISDWSRTAGVLKETFEAISTSPGISREEHELAALGAVIAGECSPGRESGACANSLLECIGTPFQGKVSAVIAQSALKSYPDVFLNEMNAVGEVVTRSFTAIKESPGASEGEKGLAALGLSAMDAASDRHPALIFSKTVLASLASSTGEPRDQTAARAALMTTSTGGGAGEKITLFGMAFRSILSYPSVTGEKRKIAEEIVGAAEHFKDPGLTFKVMCQLAEVYVGRKVKNPLGEVKAMLERAGQSEPRGKGSLIVEDEVLSIRGVRLKRRK
ncbi:MAG: hypothetical protein RDV48_10105 [Candidatus Eremiobacteraeota bacterium]|nr:hypothetical protein [Candidatus Eremiobacteraeota bacterium]